MFKKRKKANLITLYLRSAGENFVDELNFFKKQRRKRIKHNLKMIGFVLAVVFLFLLLNLVLLYPVSINGYEKALSGKNNLEQINFALSQGQFSQASIFAEKSVADWQVVLKKCQYWKYSPVGWLPGIKGKVKSACSLAQAGLNLSLAGKIILDSGQNYLPLLFGKGPLYSELTGQAKADILAELYDAKEDLESADNSLTIALEELDNVSDSFWLRFGIDTSVLRKKVEDMKEISGRIAPLAQALPLLAGYPQKADYLFVLQNSDELRPTGGFIGTIGLARIRNGEILRLDTKDVYHLDMPAQGRLKNILPEPLKKYLGVEEWYLRDANWSPDWPTSAKKILELYQKENSLANKPDPLNDFDFVVAINPKLFIDLLSLTGPLRVSGQTYTSENFVELLQDSTGRDFSTLGYSRWHRKQIIGILAQEIQKRLMDSLSGNWRDLVDIVLRNLEQKNILLYAKDYDLNYLCQERGWGGEIRKTDGDYFMVVDANMSALKTDAVMNRRIEYRLEQTKEGLTAKLKINYANTGSFTWKTTRYRSYTRVYVPVGSVLTRAVGFSNEKVETSEESGKTCFSAFVSIEPGAQGVLSLEYLLPKRIEEQISKGHYELFAQKQPGNRVNSLLVDLKFENALSLYEPSGLYSDLLDNNRVRWDTSMEGDRSFSIDF